MNVPPDHEYADDTASTLDWIVGPLKDFFAIEAAGGIVLLAMTLLALGLANSSAAQSFQHFWIAPHALHIASHPFEFSWQHVINDGLMTIFFFVVGLEIKRELVLGDLRELRQAAFPIAAAIGGMIVPALIYLALMHGKPGAHGWGIAMATDIAFVVGCMALLGSRVPRGLRIAMLTLAIVDDVGAILVIAIGYTSAVNFAWLSTAGAGLVGVWLLQISRVRKIFIYAIVGIFVWFCFHASGVHATVAGVILGLMTPAHAKDDTETSPLERLEEALHPWVSFGIMPLFAFANAGVTIRAAAIASPICIVLILSLFVGKTLGVSGASYVAVKLKIASLPNGVDWPRMIGGAMLAGIGFTMALFIASISLEGQLLDDAKVGVLIGSMLSAIAGVTLLIALPRVSHS